MINSVVLVGRLTRDLDLRKTATGRSRLLFTLAVRKRFGGQQGDDTDFINCVAWGKTAELMAQYLHKGSLIGIEGRISTRNYENNQGQRVYVTEVVADNVSFLESRNASADYQGQNSYGNQGYNQGAQRSGYSNNYNNNYNQGYSSNNGGYGGGNSNPYASSMNNNSLDSAFDEDDSFDIDSDDLPF